MLQVKNVSTGYYKRQVLDDVSFEVLKGEIVLLVGSNGSGKSTLLQVIYGILPIWNKGNIIFNNQNIKNIPTSSLLKNGILYIPQKNNLFEHLSVKENLEMAGIIIGDNSVLKERIDQALVTFKSLVPNLKKIPFKLSGGERKILTLAMATMHKPKMIMFDEPFTGLSQSNITLVTEHLSDVKTKNETSFLIVEHRIKDCLPLVDRIIGLKLGKIALDEIVSNEFNIKMIKDLFI